MMMTMILLSSARDHFLRCLSVGRFYYSSLFSYMSEDAEYGCNLFLMDIKDSRKIAILHYAIDHENDSRSQVGDHSLMSRLT
ncbi:hypothetical protein VNO80_21650 [Phaseolus coccineus]|uniref:Uncharacterized protein n=1 Tax=Phaseolus coccineus TaxID=3886 RepID=A0AAN9M8G4_PHACN